ncbi:carbonic anhydrase-related protein 10-like [Penaeus japonicus]|uniref:carbonic anhydrase-related protein 10-like n=1 Tax=Penaeus japonicus TaxID=27405 RepID=UPI001C716DB5|nr:carbonic anhydrase-related protein 10-like [Penaeus japonicus]
METTEMRGGAASRGLRFLVSTWLLMLLVTSETNGVTWNWNQWWTYDGISGTDFWGLINPDWSLCSKGRRQSPIDIDPARLLYDPNLRLLHIDKHRVSGLLENSGHSVVFTLDGGKVPLNVTGGPLSYRYQLTEAHLRYGNADLLGSEHTINGKAFPAEIQLFGFNSQLYANFSQALDKAYGIVGISLLLQIGERSNPALSQLTAGVDQIKYVGNTYTVHHLSVHDLLPDTSYYMTYEGSTTMPACHETVTWVISNKPIYITKQQLFSLRQLTQAEDANKGGAPLANNFRPPQKLHHRPVRTNIDFSNAGGSCPSMHREAYYKANTWTHS